MKIVEIVLFALVGASVSSLVRGVKPELAIAVSAATGAIILIEIVSDLTGLTDVLRTLAADYGLSADYIGILMKIIGVAFMAQLGADACRDAGESSLASKVELCGRILILAMAAPTAVAAVSGAVDLIRGAL